MYRFYNANSLGKFTDDCTIRAISVAEHKSWDETYEELSDLAQGFGTLMDDSKFIRWYLDGKYDRVPTYNMTVGELSGKYPNNTLLITMKGHIVVSKNGTIIDVFDCRNRIVEYAWLVY